MIFSELPPSSRKRPPSDKWAEIVATLKKNPDKYGLVGNFSLGVGSHIRRGRYSALVPSEIRDKEDRETYISEHWDIVTRRNGTDRADVYIKWIGEGCGCESC